MLGPLKQFSLFPWLRWNRNYRSVCLALIIGVWSLFSFACEQSKTADNDAFYAEPIPPRKQEFRWSNGKQPKSLDPALAAAPPETDIVRAIYEGLTDLDSKTLQEVPAVAQKWTPSSDYKTWTFSLRKDARWTNGEPVTANDFVRSWKRLAELGEKVPNRTLFDNIVGMRVKPASPTAPNPDETVKQPLPAGSPVAPFTGSRRNQLAESERQPETDRNVARPNIGDEQGKGRKDTEKEKSGVEAISDLELKVSLLSADKDFPKLVANPIFRPVYGDGKYFEEDGLDPDIVTNGPFQISSSDPSGVVLIRSDMYWNRSAIALESVRFVAAQSAEKALDAYKSGAVDAVTNVDLEPLALKLLSPYSDFRQATHNALNFYEINSERPPFTDRRVREALAISIERDRLTEGEMKGSTEPAFHFLPYDANINNKLIQDAARAQKLLESAGFPNGAGFPTIHLVVNRNDTQLRIARSVMRMWKQNLNLNAEITVKETSEMDAVRASGDFDIIRRGVVFPTSDKIVGLAALFPNEQKHFGEPERHQESENKQVIGPGQPTNRYKGPGSNEDPSPANSSDIDPNADDNLNDTALFDFRLIPLYFPVSYALVKPYVQGFELNGLDAPSLRDVRIDSNWQLRPAK